MIRFLAFAALALVLFTGDALACSCRWDTSVTDEYTKKDFVFTATVGDMRAAPDHEGDPDKIYWTFRVDRVFKGDVPETFVYESSRHFCAWRRFKPDTTYLIYAHDGAKPDTDNPFGISDCSRTKALKADDEAARVETEKLEVLSGGAE